MPTFELLRTFGPLVLAVATALYVDSTMARRGMLPPRFVDSAFGPMELGGVRSSGARLRRALGTGVVALILWAAAFAPLAALGEAPPDPADLTIPRLFLLHGLLVAALAAWYALGYLPRLPEVAAPTTMPPPGDAFPGLPAIPEPHRLGPVAPSQPAELPALPRPAAAPDWRVAFSFTGSVRHELAVGTAVGLAIWLGVLLVLLLLAGLVSVLGGDEALPQQPPAMVLWIAALPLPARVAIALSAGLVEEVFFRAFLQPRAGVLLSTVLFALAHLGYGQPFMLVGVTLLSLLYAELIRRRSSVWAPVAAHAVFDLVQLVVVVPLVARALEHREATEAAAALLDAVFAL